MTAHVEAMLEQAKRLTPEERAELANALWDSLEEEPASLPQAEIDRLWAAEIARRAGEMESGKVQGIDATEAIASVRASLRAHRLAR